jgi:hypothetical protein
MNSRRASLPNAPLSTTLVSIHLFLLRFVLRFQTCSIQQQRKKSLYQPFLVVKMFSSETPLAQESKVLQLSLYFSACSTFIRSFGLVLALLNKPRLLSKETSGGKQREHRYITSLVIVPHRDLAHQLYHWVQRMAAAAEAHTSPPLPSLAQVVVRDGLSHLTTGLDNLRETPPHILIGTPQALFDIWQEDPKALQLSHLSSVVVDEVDYLIETLPKKDPNRSFRKAAIKASNKLRAHPGVTRELLDVIYARRKELNEMRHDEPGAALHRRRTSLVEQRDEPPSPQLIMSSATLRSHLNIYLYEESGWLDKDNLLKVKGTTVETRNLGNQDKNNALGASGIMHSVLLVSDTGIENVSGAVPHSSDTEEYQQIDAETLFAHQTKSEAIELDEDSVKSEFHFCVVLSL